MLKVEGMRDRRLKPWNRDLDLEREQLIHLRRRLAYFLQEWVSLLPWETQPYHKLLFRLTQRMQKDSLKEESRFIRMKVWALSGTNQKRNAAAKAMKLPSSASSSAASSQVHSLDLSSVSSPSSSISTNNTNVKIPACISPRGHNIKPRNIAAGGTITEASLLANRAKSSHSTYTICSPTSSTRANGSHITVRDKHASMSIPSTSPTGAFLSSALQQHRHRPNPLFDSPSSSYNPSTPVRSGGGSNHKKSDTSSSHSAPSSLSLSLTKLKVNDLAKELTRMEFELFCRIEPTELLRDIVNTLKPLSDNYNKISFWVATQVITHKSQAKVIAKFIAVADKCMEMRNFATTMAILCGLNLQVAARAVEPLLKELPSKLIVAYERMKAQMFFSETNKNDKIYKELIHKEVRRLERSQFNRVQLPSSSTRVLQTSSDKAKTLSDVTTTTEEDAGEVPNNNNNEDINHNNEEGTEEANEEEEEDESNNKLPALVIPFAGIYAKYLTAINENPTVLPSGRLNLCKLQLWGKILYEIYVLQRKQKNVIRRNSELYAYLRNVRFESEESLWGISSMKKSQCIDASNRRK
ncbi:cell division cycle-related protein [Balamuthia mandrillaris]